MGEKNSFPGIIVHGGAWSIPDKLQEATISGVEQAAKIGWQSLIANNSALDAVEKAVNYLEENLVFDAGIGASLTQEGTVELDAIIVNGKTLDFGAVAGVKNIIHTVSLARAVMENTNHTLLISQGAMDFAKELNFNFISEKELITSYAKEELTRYLRYQGAVSDLYNFPSDTVGAVAIDSEGTIAAATSTGGITAKRPGRVGDSPIIGSGAIADNDIGGVSATGHGESILKVCLAKEALERLKQGARPNIAAKEALEMMNIRVGGKGGLIIISRNGELGHYFTTKRMAWASIQKDKMCSGIEKKNI
jgi:beta-aspartyl-peptidase (threonine type)